ncbi:TIGR00725 family protein [Amorphus sp. MBR-141]
MPLLKRSGDGILWRGNERFDPWAAAWVRGEAPAEVTTIGAREGLRMVMSGRRVRRIPVGVIGPREPNARQNDVAYEVGHALGMLGVQMACGGKGGVMEAACRGNLEAGGQPIGLLPDEEWTGANPYVAIPIATGIGAARNAILARACTALIAVGGGYGTLSEMAYGLQWQRLVLALEGAPDVAGAVTCSDADAAIDRLVHRLLSLDADGVQADDDQTTRLSLTS